MKPQNSVIDYIAQTLRENWDREALTDFKGQSLQYRAVARKIAKLHIAFEAGGIQKGDRIAFVGRNSAQWSVALLATITYGAVAVPILHDFTPDTIHHLINHSGARLAFMDGTAEENTDPEAMKGLEGIVQISDYSLVMSRNEKLTYAREHLNELFGKKYPERFTPADVKFDPIAPDAVMLINYTSGSTGFSKGVMLTEHALWSNLQFCWDGLSFLEPGDDMICMLPLAHMFGLMVEMLHPLVKGCHVNFLTRTPSPKIIMAAYAEVRPKLIVAVPLIIDKIIRTRVFPMLDKPLMKVLTHVPFVDKKLFARIRERIIETFGGNVIELIIGGAALNKDVEDFLIKIGFPFTVGYGMTECGPLISYCQWDSQKKGSCGRIVDRMEARIDSDDPANIPGLLWVRGDNVMKGYYKNPEATDAVMKDGWMNTGDICTMDSENYLFIRGRDKNMILGPSGQNIYPEEIEQRLNNLPYVAESIVIDAGEGKLEALIHPDLDTAEKQGMTDAQIEQQMKDNIKQLNTELPAYSKIQSMRIFQDEFEKTPKRSIKRYLYMK
ncbi:MAG: AMP-binding protein [Muribaculaceae bacterium]